MDEWVPIMVGGRGEAYFSGLISCGSVWHCPVCAEKVSNARRDQVAEAMRVHQSVDGTGYMATLTIRHHAIESCGQLRDRVRKAWAKVQTGKAWMQAKERAGFIGFIRSLEVTRGDNGWHPHLHILFLFDRDDPESAKAFGDWLIAQWIKKVAVVQGREGGATEAGFDFVKARTVAEAGDYVAKWGVAWELTAADRKEGRGGRTPWEILADYERDGDIRDADLFQEYARAFKGARQLQWSHKLKDVLLGISEDEDASDAELAAREDPEPSQFGRVSAYGFKLIVVKGLDLTALELAETLSWEDFVLRMGAHGVPMSCFRPPG